MWLPPACLNPEQYARPALYLESAFNKRAFCSWQAGEIVSLFDATKGEGKSFGARKILTATYGNVAASGLP